MYPVENDIIKLSIYCVIYSCLAYPSDQGVLILKTCLSSSLAQLCVLPNRNSSAGLLPKNPRQ